MTQIKASDFGFTDEEIKNIKDMNPTLDLSVITPESEPFIVKVLSEKPITIEYPSKEKDAKEGDMVSELTLEVLYNKTKWTMWLSANSLRREIFKIFQAKGLIKNLVLAISVRLYDHKVFGKNTRAYNVSVVEDEE